MEMKWAGMKEMNGTAYCMEMIPNGRAWKEMEGMSGNAGKLKGNGRKQKEM